LTIANAVRANLALKRHVPSNARDEFLAAG
jgi:hypothetical protein